MKHSKITRPAKVSLINHSMDARLGTRESWKVMEPVSRELARIEATKGHMSKEYASKLGEMNALRREDYARNFFRKMGVDHG